MGDPRKPRKQYEAPKKQWDKERIEREKRLIAEYGLKNHRELWRMQTLLRQMRREARTLLSGKTGENTLRKDQLLARAKRYFVQKEQLTVDDVLALDVRSVLDRRLQSIIYKRRLAHTPRQARQFVTHGHIAINGERVTIPSYLVSFQEEANLDWYDEPVEANAALKATAAAVAAKAAPAAQPGAGAATTPVAAAAAPEGKE